MNNSEGFFYLWNKGLHSYLFLTLVNIESL